MKRLLFTLFLCMLMLLGCAATPKDVAAPFQAGDKLILESVQEQVPSLDLTDAGSQQWVPVFSVEPLPQEIISTIAGNSYTEDSPVTLEELVLVTVTHVDFQGQHTTGQLIVHSQLGQEVMEIFQELYEAAFPIAHIGLIEEYGCDDNRSMAANNSYGYCTRLIAGTQRLSQHSYGMAVDINPVQNPYYLGKQILPQADGDWTDRTNVRPGMIVPDNVCYNAFVSRGWFWGGYWASPDYQHFEKRIVS